MAVIAVETVESFRGERMEREMGFEPTTAALEGRGSSAELLPLADLPSYCIRHGKGWPVLPENIIAGRYAGVDVRVNGMSRDRQDGSTPLQWQVKCCT